MDRRNFIKNSLLFLGCSCLIGEAKILYDENSTNPLYNNVNSLKNGLDQKYKSKNELPKRIKLETCTLCQLKCPGCNRVLYPEEFKKHCGIGYLPFKQFKKVVDDNNFEIIEPTNNGELFLNPELLDIMKYAHEKNITLTDGVGVNLNYLPDDIAEALVKYRFEHLVVSIDGASQETYEKYRVGGNFETVINNVRKINYFKKKYNSKYPELTYKFILFGHNEHEIDKAKKLAKKLNMEIQFTPNCCKWFSPIKNAALVKKKTGVDTDLTIMEDLISDYKKDSKALIYCKQLWTNPQINWDGRILGCCCIFFKDFGGNVFKDGLFNALNNNKLVYAKNMLAENAPPVDEIPCSDCIAFKLLKSNGLTVKPKNRGPYFDF